MRASRSCAASFARPLPTSRAKSRSKACTWSKRPFAAACGYRRSSSATSARQRAHKLLPQLSAHTEALLLPDDVFASAVPSETPQGVAALVRVKLVHAGRSVGDATRVAGDHCRSCRTRAISAPSRAPAEAFGATGLLLGERTVSPWNWKAIARFGGIAVSAAERQGGTRGSAAGDEIAWRARAGDVVAQGYADLRRRPARAGGAC